MATRRRPTSPADRTAVAIVALVCFAAAVALAGAGSVEPDRRGGSSAGDTVVTAIAVLVGLTALAVVAFVALRTRRPPSANEVGDDDEPIPRGFVLRPLLAPILSTLLLLAAYALVVGPCLGEDTDPLRTTSGQTTTTVERVADESASRPATKPDWTVVTGIVLGVAGLALALAAARNRRPRLEEQDGTGLDDEIAVSLADLDGLDDDGDHRRVVIRAYARMERGLGRAGVVRAPWETSQEFLRHALTNLGASAGAARRLTNLFEQACFSTHPIDESMRADAASALRAVRDEIADTAPQRTQS